MDREAPAAAGGHYNQPAITTEATAAAALATKLDASLRLDEAGIPEASAGPGALPETSTPIEEQAEAFRRQGDAHFHAQEWELAIQLYSKCIQVLESSADPDPDPDPAEPSSSSRPGSPRSNDQPTPASATSSRAAAAAAPAWLGADCHVRALRDTAGALALDPDDAASVLRKGIALVGLECYGEAVVCLQPLLLKRAGPGAAAPLPVGCRETAQAVLRDAVVAYGQSRFGVYDLAPEVFLSPESDTLPADTVCVDYVGPVEVRAAGEMGRGLFVTEGVAPGQLLLVSNALAVAPGRPAMAPVRSTAVVVPDSSDPEPPAAAAADHHPSASASSSSSQSGPPPPPLDTLLLSEVTKDLVAATVAASRACPRKRRLLDCLADSAQGAKHLGVPPMRLFTPPNDIGSSALISEFEAAAAAAADDDIDVSRVRGIVVTNAFQVPLHTSDALAGAGAGTQSARLAAVAAAFHDHPATQSASSSGGFAPRAGAVSMQPAEGLWVLPAFINHSCAPNCMWHIAGGRVMFVRAVRRIPPGEQVTIPYVNVYQPMEERTKYFSARNCRCACPRCAFERSVVAAQVPLQVQEDELAPGLQASLETVHSRLSELEALDLATGSDSESEAQGMEHWVRAAADYIRRKLDRSFC